MLLTNENVKKVMDADGDIWRYSAKFGSWIIAQTKEGVRHRERFAAAPNDIDFIEAIDAKFVVTKVWLK